MLVANPGRRSEWMCSRGGMSTLSGMLLAAGCCSARSIGLYVHTCVRLGGQVEMDVTWASRSVLESKERERKEGCIPEPGPGLT